MTKEDAYRRYAVRCAELALRATSVGDRMLLRKMAEVWLDLANLTTNSLAHVSETSGSVPQSGPSSGQIKGQRAGR
jgi:hypothetical protein